MSWMITFAISAVLSLGWTAPDPASQSGRAEHILDLMTARRFPPNPSLDVAPEKRLSVPTSVGSLIDGGPELEPTIRVTILSLDRLAYSLGDSFTYEILIQNVGSKPLRFPTSVNIQRFSRRMLPDARMAGITLLFEDSVLGRQLVTTEVLSGADAMPGSLVVIQPDETLRVRSTGMWRLHTRLDRRVPDHWSKAVKLRANVAIYYSEQPIPRAISLNSMEVLLSK